MAKKRKSARRDDNRVGKICIGIILIVFVAVMTVQINKVYQKDQEKIAEEQELREQLQYELDRQEELKEYQEKDERTTKKVLGAFSAIWEAINLFFG